MSTFENLVAPLTQEQLLNQAKDKHIANKVPVGSWYSTVNVGLSLTQIVAQLLADLRASVSEIGKSMFIQYATGDGLTLFSESVYNVERNGAQYAVGLVRLISSPASPPYNIVPGQLTVGTQQSGSQQKLYTNTSGGLLVPNSTLDLIFQAVEPGSFYNIPNATALDLKTSLVGVSVSNPIYPPTPDWISQYGAEEESDESLKERDLAHWGAIGRLGNEESMIYFAKLPPAGYTTSPVSQVRVMTNFYSDLVYTGYAPNTITIIVGQDGGNGQLSPGDLAAVRSNYENPVKYGLGNYLFVQNMSFLDINILAVVNAYKNSGLTQDQIYELVANSLIDFQKIIKIGQSIFPQKVGARIEDGSKFAIRNVLLTSPNTVVEPLFYQRPRLLFSPGNLTVNFV